MHEIEQCLTPCNRQPREAVYNRLHQSSDLQLAAVDIQRRADISILTTEGDKVSLSADAHAQVMAVTYEESAKTDSGCRDVSGEFFGMSVERQIELSVEGDLNEKERQEIKEVLKALFETVRDFLAGSFGGDMKAAEKFTGLETISNIEAEFEAKDTVALLSQASGRSVLQAERPEPIAQIPAQKTTASGAVAPVSPDDGECKPERAVADKMVAAVEASGVDPAEVQRPVDRMFGRLMRKFMHDGPFGFKKMRRLRALMNDFHQKLEQLDTAGRGRAPKPDPFGGEAEAAVAPMESFSLKHSWSRFRMNVFEASYAFSLQYSAGEPAPAAEAAVSAEA